MYENLILSNREAFASKVIDIAARLGINPSWLMVVFFIETDAARKGFIDHAARNHIGAAGLIQFMPNTAARLGTSGYALMQMTNVRQLDFVYKYLAPYAGKMRSLADTYLAVFFPIAIGRPDRWVLQAPGLTAEKVACFNPLYDMNKDKMITVGEVKTKLQQFVPKGFAL